MDDLTTDPRHFDKALMEHLNQDQARLDRIENKIDRLSDTVVAIARAEEKLVQLSLTTSEINKKIKDQEARLDRHSDAIVTGTATINGITRFLWIATAAVVVALANIYIR